MVEVFCELWALESVVDEAVEAVEAAWETKAGALGFMLSLEISVFLGKSCPCIERCEM